jgi:integrase
MKGHIRKRGRPDREVYYIVYDEPRVSGGPRKTKWVRVGSSKRDAQAKLAEVLHEMNTGAYIAPTSLTLGQYLSAHWLVRQRMTVAAKTYERCESIAKRLTDAFGTIAIRKLNSAQINRTYSQWLISGGRNGKPLSAQTVIHIHRALRHALGLAVRDGLLARNACDSVDLPRLPQKEVAALDGAQAMTLIQALSATPIGPIVRLAIFSGLRRGELLALTWKSVEFERGRIVVRQSLEQVGNVVRSKETKSKQIRAVGLDEETMGYLRRHRLSQREQRLAVGVQVADSDYVFPSPHHPFNHPWTPHSVSESFSWYASRLCTEFKGLRFHSLRHTHVALLASSAVHPHVASKRLGHSTIAFTFDRYGHMFDQQDQEAASAVAAAVRKKA